MTRTVKFGGWWVVAFPDGEYAVTYPDARIVTRETVRWAPEPLRYIDATIINGQLWFAGQAQITAGETCEWTGDRWRTVPFLTGRGVYDLNGVYRDALPAGLQFVRENGELVSRIDTYGPWNGLAERIEFADMAVGQGYQGGVLLWDGARLRVLEPDGECMFLKVRMVGERVAIAFLKSGEGSVIIQTTLSELRTLPLYQPTPGTNEPDPGTPDPPKPPEQPVPDIPNYLPVVERVREKYPTPLGPHHASFLIDLAQEIGDGAGLLEKNSGVRIGLPDGYEVAQDIICFPDGRIFDVLADGEGAAKPTWGEAHGSPVDRARYHAVARTEPPPQKPPTEEPKPEPNWFEEYRKLRIEVAELRGMVVDTSAKADIAEALASESLDAVVAIRTRLNQPRKIKLDIGKTWGHSHSGTATEEP